MKQSKYSLAAYWKNKINQNEEFWCGLFENQPITRDSVIINPVIINSYSNQHESAWAVYPSPKSVLGFLQFIYLPTAFIGLIKEEIDYQYYFQEDFAEVLEMYKDEYPVKCDLITQMEVFYNKLNDLWKLDDITILQKLEQWTQVFNDDWANMDYASVSFHVFDSPKAAVHFIIETYETDLEIEMLEDDIGMPKNELLKISGDEIYENEFLKRKFTDVLTNSLNVTF